MPSRKDALPRARKSMRLDLPIFEAETLQRIREVLKSLAANLGDLAERNKRKPEILMLAAAAFVTDADRAIRAMTIRLRIATTANWIAALAPSRRLACLAFLSSIAGSCIV
jgi:hypothetical protein